METLVILRRLPRRRFVHVEHILGAPEDDSPSSRIRQVRVLASPQQAIPMGRWNQELVPRKFQMMMLHLRHDFHNGFKLSEPSRQRLARWL